MTDLKLLSRCCICQAQTFRRFSIGERWRGNCIHHWYRHHCHTAMTTVPMTLIPDGDGVANVVRNRSITHLYTNVVYSITRNVTYHSYSKILSKEAGLDTFANEKS